MTGRTSFETDIRPLFTQRDIQAMSKAFNLASHDDVKAHSAAIYDRIRGIGGAVMPPPPPRERGPGLNPASIFSGDGWPTVVRLRRRISMSNVFVSVAVGVLTFGVGLLGLYLEVAPARTPHVGRLARHDWSRHRAAQPVARLGAWNAGWLGLRVFCDPKRRHRVALCALPGTGFGVSTIWIFELTGRGLTQHKPATNPAGSSTDVGECPERQRGRTVNPLAKPS